MFYYPDKIVYGTPTQSGLKYEEVTFPSKDGTFLTGWFVPAVGEPKGTVIHFHGNAQNMTAHFSFVSWLPKEGFNVFIFDYRGYGKSQGKPSRETVFQDCVAAVDYVKSRNDIDRNSIVLLGQSLGGAFALSAFGEGMITDIRAVAIDSTFYSYRLMVRDAIKGIPILSFLRWPLSFIVVSNSHSPGPVIKNISVPLLLIHGTDDQVIPYHHGQWLFEDATVPKEFITVPRGRHTDAFVEYGDIYRKRLVEFYRKALGK